MGWALRSIPGFFLAASKAGNSWLRRIGAATTDPNWQLKAAICERCPLRIVKCGISYCGKPYLQRIDRDPAIDGCGCPCHEKAKSVGEHCPLNNANRFASRDASRCTCKWCEGKKKEFGKFLSA